MALIHERMIAILQDIEAIGKDSRNTMQNFNFRGIDDIYNELHGLFKKHQVLTLPEVLEERSEDRLTAKGGTLIYRILKIKYHFVAIDGSEVTSIVEGEAMDSGDKACNKAMSIAHKYCLLQVFMIPTKEEKDPDFQSYPESKSNKSSTPDNKSYTEAPASGGTFKADATAALKASALPAAEKDSLLKQLESKPANLQKAFYEGCILPRIKKAGNKAQPEADPDEGIPFENYAEQEAQKKAEPKKEAAPKAETTVGRQFDDDPIGLY